MTVHEILAFLTIVVAAPLNWLVAVLLWQISHRAPDVIVLRDRAIVATAMAVIVTIFGLVFLNNDLGMLVLNIDQTRLVTRSAILAVSTIPAVYWLRIYRSTV